MQVLLQHQPWRNDLDQVTDKTEYGPDRMPIFRGPRIAMVIVRFRQLHGSFVVESGRNSGAKGRFREDPPPQRSVVGLGGETSSTGGVSPAGTPHSYE